MFIFNATTSGMQIVYALSFLYVIGLLSCNTGKRITSKPPLIPAVVAEPAKVDSVQPKKNMSKTDAFLEDLLKTRLDSFNFFLANRDSLQGQIIYTQINRQADNTPLFTSYYFNVDSGRYFYPASTVKMPVALLTLQKLHELKVFGLNSNSTMITGSGFSGQTPVHNDPSTPDGRPTIAHYIKKIFLTSDNDAFNRLYEFLGPKHINGQLHKMGYTSAEILHRLSIVLTEEENRHTNPVSFFSEESKPLYSQPMQYNDTVYPVRKDTLGSGYMSGSQLVEEPLDFSRKNRISLEDLTAIHRAIIFPDATDAGKRFNLQQDDYRFVWKYMSQLPSETTYPEYDTTAYRDALVKFLLYGSQKGDLPKNIRIFNKVGNAYGFLTDVAYIVDFDKNIEFMLSAGIYCNSDGILNDNKYDYETVGFPFMKNLGELIYDYELKRERRYPPDLSEFKMEYDK